MSLLHRLRPHPGATKRVKRVGRGPGSGHGKTSTRGHKGQKQHGKAPRPGFEGGQMPLIRTTPKRGFSARSKERFQILNLSDLSRIKASQAVVDPAYLFEHDLLASRRMPVKILGDGELTRAVNVRAHAFSRSAKAKIEKAGGRAEFVTKSKAA